MKWSTPTLTASLILLLNTIHITSHSQRYSWFSHKTDQQPFIAEQYGSLIKMELVKMNSLHPFYYKSNATRRPFIEVQTGIDLPLLLINNSYDFGEITTLVHAPVSILTLVDMFESQTAPVIDNDYRFGFKVTVGYTPNNSENRFIKNYHLTLVPIFHESTHLGDEFSLHGYSQIPDFARINLSYEAWQLFLGINRRSKPQQQNLSAELGYQRLMPYKQGYYDIDPFEVKYRPILKSIKRDLWILRMQYIYPFRKINSQMVASMESRRETKFGYSADYPERRTWSVNFYTGYRVPIKNSKRQLGIYYRHYRGIVPYGQLRNEGDFILNGVSIVVN